MKGLKRVALPLAMLSLILGLGALGLTTIVGANSKSESVHREDRVFLQSTLTGLTNQYVQFALKEAFDHASGHPWTLRPGDPSDFGALKAFIERSALFNHGAALVGLDRNPINAFAKDPGLPPATDPGYVPLIGSLLKGEPGLSSVMILEGAPIVALGVPVMHGSVPAAVFLGYFRADLTPLQEYTERLIFGKTSNGFVVDSLGVAISSSDPALVGTRVGDVGSLTAVAEGRTGSLEFQRDGTTRFVSFGPVGLGGWGALTEQDSAEFYGPIRSGGVRALVALLGLLVAAAVAVAVIDSKRQIALKRAYDYKGQLLANTTHELKTPLTAIRGASMTLGTRWRDMDPEQVEMFLGMIHRRCDGLSKLIDRILMGARLEAGREVPIRLEPVELTPVLRRIATEFADAAPRHPFRVAAPEGLWVRADAEALDQIVGLLSENAVKYSPDGGEVALEAEIRGTEAIVRVVDSGVGINEADQAHIFEPYYKASRGDTQRFGGVGLGLAITRHLVRAQGGDISVASRPGSGTVFSFTLRLAKPAEGADTSASLVEAER